MGRRFNTYFSKDINGQEAHENCSTSLIIRENANENYSKILPHTIQNNYHEKKSTNNKWRAYEEKATLLHCWRECKLIQPLCRSLEN